MMKTYGYARAMQFMVDSNHIWIDFSPCVCRLRICLLYGLLCEVTKEIDAHSKAGVFCQLLCLLPY